MTEKMQVYKCEVCGNIVTVLHEGKGQLVCCGKPMVLIVANTVDAAKEKHVPVAGKTADGVEVKVGSVAHPMEEKHYIEWILVTDGKHGGRAFLNPGDAPVHNFQTDGMDGGKLEYYAYCNLHGLWKA
ncbi:MAG: desulfoferrodoxin [Thermodesulfobacteriota bacterium]|nr:desulfoferrodoxin [Thermodesulfobacteriota bacterium]